MRCVPLLSHPSPGSSLRQPPQEDAFYSESRNLDDWNVRFQEAQSVIQEFDANTNLKDRIGVNVALIHLYQDFLYSVRTYASPPLLLPPRMRVKVV